ncbi:hypothetical protein [Halobacillus kuroshimensis]|uniref:hypothetical protein n=1 Tax=Halobacillus kuroshimensis TaxID=302481 RepID=UPI0004149E62|nr:hypothetical protein [Halobacillus kuroshimensis]
MENKQVNIRFTMPQEEFHYYENKAHEEGMSSGTSLIKMYTLKIARKQVKTNKEEKGRNF